MLKYEVSGNELANLTIFRQRCLGISIIDCFMMLVGCMRSSYLLIQMIYSDAYDGYMPRTLQPCIHVLLSNLFADIS